MARARGGRAHAAGPQSRRNKAAAECRARKAGEAPPGHMARAQRRFLIEPASWRPR